MKNFNLKSLSIKKFFKFSISVFFIGLTYGQVVIKKHQKNIILQELGEHLYKTKSDSVQMIIDKFYKQIDAYSLEIESLREKIIKLKTGLNA